MNDIIDRIKDWCSQKGLTPAELAKELGMNRSTVVHMLNGRNKPNLLFIVKLASYDEGIDVRALLTGKPSPSDQEPAPRIKATPSPTPPPERVVHSREPGKLIVLSPDGTYKSYVEE